MFDMELHGAHIEADGDIVTVDMPHDPFLYSLEAWQELVKLAGVSDPEWVVSDEHYGPGSRTRIVYRRIAG